MAENEGSGGSVQLRSPCRLILVRHGETEWNRAGRYQGRQDIPLSRAGHGQARKLADRLREEKVAAVYASDLLRTRQTATPIVGAFGLSLRLEPGLREMCYGDWEGLTRAEIARAFPEEFGRWMRGEEGAAPPNGESAEACAERAEARLGQIARAHPNECAVVVTHGGPIRAYMARWLGMPLGNRGRLVTGNASLHLLETDGQNARVLALNDTCHLRT